MPKRPLAAFLAAVALSLPLAVEAAGEKDAAATKLDADAMQKDYLETRFSQARTKLDKAIASCGKAGCSSKVLAKLHRDLGVVLLGGLNKGADAKKAFIRARELDPKIALDKDFTTPAMKKAWADAGGGAAVDAPKLEHVAVSEQKAGHPIPIYATLADAPAEAEVRLWHKAGDATTWSHLTMAKRGDGYAAEVPCSATAKEGEVAYFVAVQGPDGETLTSSGSREEPLKVQLKKTIDGEAPHLPDAEPPKRCGGEEPPPESASTGARKNWFYLTFEQDLALIGSGTGVCTPGIQAEGQWSCFRSDGAQYRGTPVHAQGDAVNGGLSVASTRIHVGYDRVLVGGLTLGARAGVAIRGIAPSSTATTAGHGAFPGYFEGRLAYWFGSDPFGSEGLRPFVLVDGGAASVDTKKSTIIREQRGVTATQSNPDSQSLDAWRSMGTGFVGGGLGLMYAFTPRAGILLDVRYARMFGRAGSALMPEIGFGFGI